MKVIFYANTEWYLFNFRLALAKHLRALGHQVTMVSPPGPYGARLEAEGFLWLSVPMARRSVNPVSELRALLALQKIFRREHPELVHNFTIKCTVYGTLAARFSGVPAVVNAFDGLGYIFSSRSFRARILSFIVSRLISFTALIGQARFVLQNDSDQNFLVSNSLVKADVVRLIHGGTGIDTERFRPLPSRPPGPPLVLFASRLLREKGIEEFVLAARQLKNEGLLANFVVAGAPDLGNPGSVDETDIDQWKSWNAVDFVGHVDDMPRLLGKATVIVLATAYGEGVPRILIEGAACGAALITTDHPGCREIVEHEKNGLLIEPRNVAALSAALKRLLSNPQTCRCMGEYGRKKVIDEFDERVVFKNTLAVYRELLPAF